MRCMICNKKVKFMTAPYTKNLKEAVSVVVYVHHGSKHDAKVNGVKYDSQGTEYIMCDNCFKPKK